MKTLLIRCCGTSKQTRLLKTSGLLMAAIFCGPVSLWAGPPVARATLENQWRKLPEVTVKPESGGTPSRIGQPAGGAVRAAATAGGNAWQQDSQVPQTVPVQFYLEFMSDHEWAHATLAGQTVSAQDPLDWSEFHPFCDTDMGVANLKPNQTYILTMGGVRTYTAYVYFIEPSLNDLFANPSVANQPARLYHLYYFNPDSQKWLKICPNQTPMWIPGDEWVDFTCSFKIQLRPDLGARPITKPGQRVACGDDQADDAWTGEQPAMDASTAPGDGSPVAISSSKLGDPASARFNWSVSLGRRWSGAGAASISFDESRLSTNACTPALLNYVSPSADTNEIAVVMDLDDTNCLSQVCTPQALATAEPLYGSALLGTTNLLNIPSLVQKLTNTSPDTVSQYFWSNFTTNAQQTLTNTNSTQNQLASTLVSEINRIIQAGSIYETNRFSGIVLSGRTRRLLLASPSGVALVRLNRFLLEDSYPAQLARLLSTQFDLNFYLASCAGPGDALGFFTLLNGATPFVDWRIGFPGGGTNQWQLQEIRNGATNTTLLTYTAPGTWTLTRGVGNEARTETRTIATNTINGTNFCTETQEVKNGAGTVSDRTTEVYQRFDWGYELVTAINDPNGANLVTTFNFNANTNLPEGGKIASILYPDGFWERREYSEVDAENSPGFAPLGALIRTVQPWQDTPITAASPDCLVTDYAYYPDQPGSYALVKWHDPTGQRPYYAVADYQGLQDRADMGAAYSEVYRNYQDQCASDDVSTETRILGCIHGYGEWQDTVSYAPWSLYLAGLVDCKDFDTAKFDSYDYEFGTWDPGSLVFTPNADPLTPGPTSAHDLRQTIFHGADANYVDPDTGEVDFVGAGLSGNQIAGLALEPLRSTVETRIIQGGNLVAKELYVYQGDYNFALLDQVIYQRDSLGHAISVERIDPATHLGRVTYAADWTGPGAWPGDLKLAETDEDGTTYAYTYDSLKRLKTKTKQPASGQSAIVTTLAYDAANRVLTNTVSAGSLSQTTKLYYDLAGRKTNETDAAGLTTSYAYADIQGTGRRTTLTLSSGATQVSQNYADRRVASVTGSAVTNLFYSYAIDPTEPNSEDLSAPRNVTTIHLGSSNSLRWTATYTDKKNFLMHEVRPAFNNANVLYRSYRSNRGLCGQPEYVYVSGLTPDGSRYPEDFKTAYDYDYFSQRDGESQDMAQLGIMDCWNLASTTRITTWTNFYELDGSGDWFHVSEQWAYPFDNDPTPSLVERTRQRLTGFSANELSEIQSFDADTNQTTIKVAVDLANKKLTITTNIAQSSLTASQVVVNGLVQTESSTTVAQVTTHYYDSLGRETSVRDPLGNLTSTTFDPVTGRVIATTNPHGLTTTLEYYPAGGTNAGLLKCQTGPTGRKTYYNYNGPGQVIQTWGDVPYPEQREYNQFGDLVTLTTYRGGNQWTGSSWPASTGTGDVTHWYYDEATGLLTNKTDAAGQAVTFTYYDNWYPKTKIWARGVASTNVYDNAHGELVRIDYSDGSSVAFTDDAFPSLNRQSKPAVVIDAAGTNYLTYDYAGRLLSTYCTNGLLAGITVTNHFNPVYGRDALKVLGPSWAMANTYGYDGYGRMGTVANGIYAATYGYLTGSDLLQTTTCKSNTTTVLTTTRTWETGPRLRSIANTVNGAPITSHSYLYDWLDRRIQATLEDGSLWKYNYNDRNELIGAHHFWPDWSPVAGQQYGYDYDNIGNRQDANWGGDTNGWNLRTTFYTANNLNQYTNVTNPGYASIIGAALATNGVTVNSGAADRKGEYFHDEISVANGSGPLWQSVSVISGGSTTNGGCALPANSQRLTYDADGNLTFDGTWTYQWDCENRLVAMTMTNIASVANSNRLRLEFVYDYQGRRMAKTVKAWNGSAFSSPVTTLFVYDDRNLISELSSPSSALRNYIWGLDLSGTEDEAGGVGGLLAVFEMSNGQISNCHFASYDGNGNITALVKSSDLSTSTHYEFSPFGETLRSTGPMAKVNPFRFSTKFVDDESGLVDYGFRYYSPWIGRWLSRDPVGERDVVNLFLALRNRPLDTWDLDGRFIGMLISLVASDSDEGRQAVQDGLILKRVKDLAGQLDGIQNFMDGYMMASDLVGESKVLDGMITRLDELKQSGELGKMAHRHHMAPRALWPKIKKLGGALKNFDPDKFCAILDSKLHLSMHGKGYNSFIRDFLKKNSLRIKQNPLFLIGFLAGTMEELGFGEAALVP